MWNIFGEKKKQHASALCFFLWTRWYRFDLVIMSYARKGHERAEELKAVIHAKLKDAKGLYSVYDL